MTLFLETLKIIFVILGTAFSLIGIIGMIRLPDVYTRLHATGKVNVFGLLFLLAAAMTTGDISLGKGFIYIIIILMAGPVVSHAILRAAYYTGIKMKDTTRDDLLKKPKS